MKRSSDMKVIPPRAVTGIADYRGVVGDPYEEIAFLRRVIVECGPSVDDLDEPEEPIFMEGHAKDQRHLPNVREWLRRERR